MIRALFKAALALFFPCWHYAKRGEFGNPWFWATLAPQLFGPVVAFTPLEAFFDVRLLSFAGWAISMSLLLFELVIWRSWRVVDDRRLEKELLRIDGPIPRDPDLSRIAKFLGPTEDRRGWVFEWCESVPPEYLPAKKSGD